MLRTLRSITNTSTTMPPRGKAKNAKPKPVKPAPEEEEDRAEDDQIEDSQEIQEPKQRATRSAKRKAGEEDKAETDGGKRRKVAAKSDPAPASDDDASPRTPAAAATPSPRQTKRGAASTTRGRRAAATKKTIPEPAEEEEEEETPASDDDVSPPAPAAKAAPSPRQTKQGATSTTRGRRAAASKKAEPESAGEEAEADQDDDVSPPTPAAATASSPRQTKRGAASTIRGRRAAASNKAKPEPAEDEEEEDAETDPDDDKENESDFQAEPAPAQTRSQRKRRAAIPRDDGSDAEAADDDDDDDEESDAAPAAPKPKRKTAAAKPSGAGAGQGRKRAARAAKDGDVDEENMTLFDHVVDGKGSLETLAAEWAAVQYANDREGAVAQLVDLVMQAAGYPPNSISRDVLENPDEHDVGEEVEEAGRRAEENPSFNPHDPPLTSKKPRFALRSKAAQSLWPGNRFSRSYREWWVRWVGRVRTGIVKKPDEGAEDQESDPETWAWEVLKVWTHQLSTSAVRTLRHAATAAGLGVLGGLVETTRTTVDAEAAARRQLEAADGPKTKAPTSAAGGRKREVLEQRVRELEGERAKLEEEMMAYFDGIFVHRYRDVDPTIRADCSRELGAALHRLPEVFLDPMYLRYIGWALSDKSASVRIEPIRTLHRILTHPQASTLYIPGFRQFFERFRPRLLDIARGDIDPKCREEAVRVCIAAADHGFMDEQDAVDTLLPMVVGSDYRIAQMIGPYVAKMIEEESEELGGQVGGGAEKKDAVRVKVLCQLLARACETASRREMAAPSRGASSTVSQFQSMSMSQSQSSKSQTPAASQGREDPFGKSWELNEQAVEAIRWLKEEAGAFSSGEVSAPRIKQAVEALWDHCDVVKNLTLLCSHISDEPVTAQARARNPLILTATEETVLVHLLPRVLDALIEVEEDAHAKAEVRTEYSIQLVTSVPKIIAKYGSDYMGEENSKRLVQAVSLFTRVDSNTYVNLRMSKAFEQLLADLHRIFTQHEDVNVLREIATALRAFMVPANSEESSTTASAKRKKSQATVASSVDPGLSSIARRKMEELLEDLLSALTSSVDDIANSLGGGDLNLTAAQDLASPTRSTLKRLLALLSVIDLGGNLVEEEGGEEVSEKVRLAFETLRSLRSKASEIPLRSVKGKSVVRPGVASTRATGDEALRTLLELVDEGLDAGIRILSWAIMWASISLINAGLASQFEVEDIDDEPSGAGPATLKKKAPSGGSALDFGKRKLQTRVETLVSTVESVLNGNIEEESDTPSFGVLCTATRVLGDMAFLLDGNIGVLVPEASAALFPLSEEVQEGMANAIGTLVEVASGLRPRSTTADQTFDPTIDDETEIDPADNPVRCPFERQLVPSIAKQLELSSSIALKLLAFDRLDPKFAPNILKWVGVASESAKVVQEGQTPASAPPVVLDPFFWDTVVGQNLCKHLVSDLGRAAIAGQVDSGSEKSQGKLNVAETPMQYQSKRIRSALNSILMGCVLECMEESLEFFFSGRLPSIDHTISLARSFSTELKSWSAIFSRAPQHRREATIEACIAFLRKGSELMANRVHDCVRSSNRVASHLRGPKQLGPASQGWKPWALIASAVANLLGIAGKEDGQNDISHDSGQIIDRIREGVISELESTLSGKQLKPSKGAEWEGYHAFISALEGSTMEEKKIRKGRKPVSTARSTKAVATKRAPKAAKVEKSKAKPLLFTSADSTDNLPGGRLPAKSPRSRRRYDESQGDDEESDTDPPAQPVSEPRRSGRSTAPRKSFREIDGSDDDEDEAEDISDRDGGDSNVEAESEQEQSPDPELVVKPKQKAKAAPLKLLAVDASEPSGAEEEEHPDPDALMSKPRRPAVVYGKGSGSGSASASASAGRGTKRNAKVANGYLSDSSQGDFVDDRAAEPVKRKRVT
ncbi:hypothetical protein M427DRAFT_157256 [Gonapodya prolifera JEL478]|uniref:SCD domain-containing protein n=1 Tax=Gonapodya prolifera (strain JEL478) TaxID=1344416 RepID=A0A139A6U6_GONPJ|nr:hypothetical protein M427DRAFT_157256 [Gonapodya prolifera JEL478]|eukprot:KXS12491.1 hypothetical protein M427DRAFT_157256 [Gonapodya prolifera JEL478]